MRETPAAEPALVYPGKELELFATATHWKSYVGAVLRPWIRGQVLEVGAGMGSNLPMVLGPATEAQVVSWTGVEPDPHLFDQLQQRLEHGGLAAKAAAVPGTLESLPADRRYDTILYLDVLEHIEDDHAEFRRAVGRLSFGGHLVILCPAHPWLFSPFDISIGHHRRHNRASFLALPREGVALRQLRYLDSVGLLASAGNRLLLRQSMPTEEQIRLWDGLMVPLSRWLLDPLTFWRIGKSVLGVWERVVIPSRG